MHRRTPASSIASGALATNALCILADITSHGFLIGVLRATPAPLAISGGSPAASTCPREHVFASRPRAGCQECQRAPAM
eukprot:2679923-Pyramimonas_sp.AAC.2